MKLSKSVLIGIIVISIIIFIPACNKKKRTSYKNISAIPAEKLGKRFELKKDKELILKSGSAMIGDIYVFRKEGDKLLVIDPLHSRRCYLFDKDGILINKVGRFGQGPGEYQIVLAACISGDRIFLVENYKINIYSETGEFLNSTRSPFAGICCGAYKGPDGSFYALTFNRYNAKKDTIYHLDKDGNLINSFSPIEEDVPKVFDTFFPQVGLCIDSNSIIEFYNYKYGFSFFDFKGNKIKEVTLSSPLYTPPDLNVSKLRGHRAEKEYGDTFSMVSGLFKFSSGYATFLINGKNSKEDQGVLEFWDKDFKRIGYLEMVDEGRFLGIYDDNVLFTQHNENETKIIFRKIIL